jgi:hypothetical protein
MGNSVVTALVVLGLIAVVGFLVLRGGKTKPKPAPAPVVPVPGIPAPAVTLHDILDLSWVMPPNGGWIEGNLVKFGVTYSEHGCGPIGIKKNGFEDNGTGPYACMISATVRETGGIQAVYRQDNNEFCNDRWVPCNPKQPVSQGLFYMRLGGLRGWFDMGSGGCSPTITPVLDGPPPNTGNGKTFVLDFTIRVRNVAGNEPEPRRYGIRVLARSCAGNPDAAGQVIGPCEPCN